MRGYAHKKIIRYYITYMKNAITLVMHDAKLHFILSRWSVAQYTGVFTKSYYNKKSIVRICSYIAH